jgi:hypothetical protein
MPQVIDIRDGLGFISLSSFANVTHHVMSIITNRKGDPI